MGLYLGRVGGDIRTGTWGVPHAQELVLRWCEWSGECGESKVFSWFMVVYAVEKYVGWLVGSWGHLVGS